MAKQKAGPYSLKTEGEQMNNHTESFSKGPISVEAKTLEMALVKAAVKLGVKQHEVGYEVVKKTGGGFLGIFGGSKVVLSAWKKAPESEGRRPRGERSSGRGERSGRGDRASGRGERSSGRGERHHNSHNGGSRFADSSAAENSEPAEPLSEEKIEALRAELRDFCASVCGMIVNEDVKVSDSLVDGRLILDIENDSVKEMLVKNAKLAESLEHLLRKKPRHLRQELPFRIFIDADGNRKGREVELVQMAKDLSAQVHENKRPIVLNYKSSYDRKIIHMALDQDDRVYTKSIGSGPNRKLMILPSKGGSDQMESTEINA